MNQACCRYLSVLPLALLLLLGWSAYLPTAGLATELPVYGGPGGNPFRAECPKGSYLVGLAGKTGSWVDRIAPVCAPWLRGSQTFGAPSIGQSFGMSTGGHERQTLCTGLGGNRHAIQSWWIHLVRSDDHYVQFIQMYCASLTTPFPVDSGSRLNFGTFPDNVEELVTGGPFPSQPPYQVCPNGEAAVGIRVQAGRFVDAIGLICGPMPATAGAPLTKLPGPLTQAPSAVRPMKPVTKNMMIPDDMFVIIKPTTGDRVQPGQLIIAATAPKIGMTNVTELELRYLDAPPNQANAYPYTTVFSVDTATLLQGYSVAPIVTGYIGRWQVRARSAMKTVPGPWSFPVQFNMEQAQAPPPMMQMPKPNAPITQTPAPGSSMMQAPTPSGSATTQMRRSPSMIMPRGIDEKGGEQRNDTVVTTPEMGKKP